ncbi:histidine phosphatase family protein [Spiractinospora alimapuensis]|uniref:histidine phosphatase family protein n=1 Tax=Spiractinospora alimapuensis TaxID=2820884 RepID=UPI001F1A90EB|nr:histidine phosphatase family protein [Spiractinospora alimapuensis]QVQ51752.1 histidine phosphatase family protein [Spiractinospora alimapuensis]
MTNPRTTLYVVRHGETTYHGENRYCGSTDAPLDESGVRQARNLARWAGGAGLTAVYSSTLSRAVDTADPCARAAGVMPLRDERLVEVDFGQGEGLTSAEMRDQWPQERAAFERDPVAHHLPGGEDPVRATRRGRAALDAVVSDNLGGTVLVVCHGTLLRLMVCSIAGIALARYRDLFPVVRNTAGFTLRYSVPGAEDTRNASWSVLGFNVPLAVDD